jgi:hypothetical protein
VLTDANVIGNGNGNAATNTGDLRFCVANAASGDTISFASTLSGTLTLAASINIANTALTVTGAGMTPQVTITSGGTLLAPSFTAITVGNMGNLILQDLNISNCNVGPNGSGAAINEANGATVFVNGCDFNFDQAGAGGAIACNSGSSLTIGNYIAPGAMFGITSGFSNDTANTFVAGLPFGLGGAIWCQGATLTMVQYAAGALATGFTDDTANSAGGALFLSDGTTANINNTYITENSAGSGGGIYITDTTTVATLEYDVIDYNTAGSGAGIFMFSGNLTFNDPVFSTSINNNTATIAGGGMEVRAGTLMVNNGMLVVSNNTAPSGMGDGVYIGVVSNGAVLVGQLNIDLVSDTLIAF